MSMETTESERGKYKVTDRPRALKSWESFARMEIQKWLDDESYREEIMRTTLSKDVLYHFAFLCETGWGVMVDFNEYRQRIVLCDHYYKWMHKLRDELIESPPKAKP